MSAVPLYHDRSDREVGLDEGSLARDAEELSSAAQRLRASATSPVATDADLRAFMLRIANVLGDLEAATAHVARRLAPHRQPFDRRSGMDLERRMHELVSSLAAARYSGELARRELRSPASTAGRPAPMGPSTSPAPVARRGARMLNPSTENSQENP